ncbi:1-phosphofructokinase [Pokkaliibacter sp. CJK22405]|uniref:1-phosphofructokinase n=1 Tax=Pokkaliibacter sp. CJK22405 TaxID=3384615 RepID=UPI00398523FF
MTSPNKPITTLTLNPALDLTVQLGELQPGEVNLAHDGNLRPAGKGINVAMVLSDLGNQVTVSGILGQENRAAFDELFHERGFDNRFIYEAGSTRVNVKLSETGGRVTDINLPGIIVSDDTKAALNQQLEALEAGSDVFVLSGSLPRGLAADTYHHLINTLHQAGKRVVLDTSGKALMAAVSAAPWLIKPNVEELEQWAGRELPEQQDQEQAVREMLKQGITHVVLSDGEKGVRWYSREGAWQAISPKIDVVSTVGAGDSLVAGLTHGLVARQAIPEVLRLATAVAALAVNQVGVGVSDPDRLEQLQQQVSVTPLMFSLEESV